MESAHTTTTTRSEVEESRQRTTRSSEATPLRSRKGGRLAGGSLAPEGRKRVGVSGGRRTALGAANGGMVREQKRGGLLAAALGGAQVRGCFHPGS